MIVYVIIIAKIIHVFVFPKEQLIKGTDDWNQFSCIHSTINEGFNFVVYNASHKLKGGENVNPATRVRIMFPKNSSYFIVFHGRLVHNGDESIKNKDGNFLYSPRMFSYLTVPDHVAKFNGNCRTSPRLMKYVTTLKENKVDRSSFAIGKPSENSFINGRGQDLFI